MATISKRLEQLARAIHKTSDPVPFMAAYPPEGEKWAPEFLDTTTGRIYDALPPGAVVIGWVGERISAL